MGRRDAAIATVIAITALARTMTHALAQAPGYAEITSPAGGQSIEGLITIQGTADHPAFLQYDLAFAYDPNPTGTWFPIGEPSATRAREATLALWDATDVTPGEYQLRLRVFLEGGAILEDTVAGLRVGLPAVPLVSSGDAPAPTATVPAAPTATLLPPPTPAPEPGDPVGSALGIGGLMSAALLLLLAAFLPLRRGLSLWAGNMRMRRILRQDVRRRRGSGER